jgi:hypothetical protein
MAHIWLKDNKEEWMAMALNNDVMTLTKDGVYPVSIVQDEKTVQGSVFIKSWQHAEEQIWLVMAGRGTRVWVNGRLLQTGIRFLKDRDDVRVHDQLSVFFSTEQLARVVPYTPGASPVFCPRCKQPLVDGTPGVQCPQCGVWEHQDETQALECWLYAERCAVCDHLTDLHAGFRWTPSGL